MTDEAVKGIKLARTTMLGHFTGEETLAGWIKTCRKHYESVEYLNPWWKIDHSFIESYAENDVAIKIRGACVELLERNKPQTADKYIDVDAVKAAIRNSIGEMQTLAASQLVLCVGEAGLDDVTWAQSFANNLLSYHAPTSQVQASFTSWRTSVVNALMNYVSYTGTSKVQGHLFNTPVVIVLPP